MSEGATWHEVRSIIKGLREGDGFLPAEAHAILTDALTRRMLVLEVGEMASEGKAATVRLAMNDSPRPIEYPTHLPASWRQCQHQACGRYLDADGHCPVHPVSA